MENKLCISALIASDHVDCYPPSAVTRTIDLTRYILAISTHAGGNDRTELDSHADTCVAAGNCLKVADTDKTVNVSGFNTSQRDLLVPICSVATLWTSEDGTDYCLVIHEALYFGDATGVKMTLLNPNQLRANGLIVEDVPKQFDRKSSHSITVPAHSLVIPLDLRGIMSGFDSRKPTWDEYENLPRIELTNTTPWLPHNDSFADNEVVLCDVTRTCPETSTTPDEFHFNLTRQVCAFASYLSLSEPLGLLCEQELASRMVAAVHVTRNLPASDSDVAFKDASPQGAVLQDQCAQIAAVSTGLSRPTLTPESLAQRWGIGLDTAKRTLKVTTQAGIRNVLSPGERKVRHRLNHLRFPTLKAKFYSDTMKSNSKSMRGFTQAQVYTNGCGFDRFYPMNSEKEMHSTLMQFIHDDGIPQTLVTDGAAGMVGGKFLEVCKQYHIDRKITTPYSPWRNKAEASIRELKTAIRKMLRRSGAPRRLWCYAGQRAAALRRLCALDIVQLDGRTPFEAVTGTTPDISSYAQFDFYELVWYYTPTTSFPNDRKTLGYMLCPFEGAEDELAFQILTDTGHVVTRKSVWAVSDDDRKTPQVMALIQNLAMKVNERLGDDQGDNDPDLSDVFPIPPGDFFDEDELVDPIEPDARAVPEQDDFTPEAYDEYLAATIALPHGGEPSKATVISRRHGADGNPIGRRNNNPLLDTREYEVQFADGSIDTFTANVIAENLYSQVDAEGLAFSVMKEIVDHRKNGHAISIDDGFHISHNGNKTKKRTTAGWEMCLSMTDGDTVWLPMKDVKASNPVELAEYAVANKIADEPAFAWWATDVLRHRDRIICKVKSRYWSRTHKYGVELPKTVLEALAIDKRTGTTFWRDAIAKEMKNVMIAFEFRDDDKVPIGYQQIMCHMIFDVKMVGLVRKARLVAGGHMTEVPKDSTYSSVVSRDSVRIAFLIAALNDLDILAADVQNAYLNAPTKEKVYTIAGPEFGATNEGRPVILVRALYGLKSSGARWRDHMAATLREGGFVGCVADPDVWMRKQVKPNGEKYWEYVLIYVDDALVISHDPQAIMDYLSSKYRLKEGSVKQPTEYLGARIEQYNTTLPSGETRTYWGISSEPYVVQAIKDVETELAEIGKVLMSKAATPLSGGYRPEIDATPLLGTKQASYYQGLIGVLRWICELGRIDIVVDVALMSRCLAAPRAGHLEQVLHIFAYLKQYSRSKIVMDSSVPRFNVERFHQCDWTEFYNGAKEVLPPNAPEERGQGVTMTCFVDADHAGCQVTRRSHTGILIYLNKAPILWYSKRQNTVESSTFGSEFIAAKVAIDMIEGLRYKLRMMGIPIDGPTNLFGDNQSVVTSATHPESALRKKHNAIAYHRVREALAAEFVIFSHEPGLTNLSDILSKPLPGPRKRGLSHLIMR